MTKKEFLKTWKSPLPAAVLKKYPTGNIMQYWADSPNLYSGVYGRTDDIGKFTAGHTGVDIKTFHRDKVLAPFAGKIVGTVTDRKNSLGGLQLYLDSPELDDNGAKVVIQTGFAHLDEIAVEIGQEVKVGDLLGYEGNTGFVVSGNVSYWGNAPAGTGTHLHWTTREFLIVNGEKKNRYKNSLGDTTDPLYYLNADVAGTLIYLANIQRLLAYWKARYFGGN